eukprot:s414_g21.t1
MHGQVIWMIPKVVESLASELSQVDQYVFLLPAIRPYLLMETCSLQQVVLGLKQPWVPRELYQQVLQQRNESIFDASAPLHGSLELLRPYLQPLLSRPVAPSANRAAPVTLTASKVQCLQYATVNPHIPASRSLPCCAEASTREYHSWCPVMPKSFQHPLGFLSFQAYLVKAFCLPPKVNDLGSLSFLDGTPYSMYSMPSSISSSARAETEAGATPLQDSLSQEEMADLDTVVSVTDRSAVGVAWGVGRSPPQAWRPKGQLLATLYEYAHQSGVPVVKADTTDDSRVLVTGGRDGTVKLWCCAQLESDTAPSSFYGIQVPQRDSRPDAGLRALRTIRNSKAFATASDDQVLLYRVESSRSGAKLVSRCQSQEKGAVMFIDQLDTELESLVLFAQAHGTLRGWDLRGPKDAWTLPVPPCLGLPLSVATQRLSVTVGTAAVSKSSSPEMSQMYVVKRDGSQQEVKFDSITQRLRLLCDGLDPEYIDPVVVTKKVIEGFYNGISTAEVDTLAAETCAYMSQKHPDFSILAARIAVSNLHKNTSSSFYETCQVLYNYKDKQGRPAALLSEEVFEFVKANADQLDAAIDYKRDFGYDYFGFKTLEKSYLLRVHGKSVERPQHLIMRAACGIHCGDVAATVETYDLMSRKFFTHATPTLFNSGTPKPQMSSCFLLKMKEDSIEGIYDTLKQCALISKSAGGIGVAISNVRASGSYIRGTNGHSNGLVPMLRNFNETARYVDQGGGKRKGSFAMYLEPWHADVYDFIELRKNHGKEEQRARDLFLGLWIPDLFMKRVKQNEEPRDWTLFCPNEAFDTETGRGLMDLWGEDFERLYEKLEADGKGRKTIKAQHLWFRILEAQMETGTPYMLYKDHCNRKSNQQNLGTIHCSNLCTEIIEYTSPDEVAVCNLASIALSSFVAEGRFDFEQLHRVTKEEARRSNMRHRPVGLGVQGLADAFLMMKLPFESPGNHKNIRSTAGDPLLAHQDEARELNEAIFETIYFAACEASCELAELQGSYETYAGSPASKGQLQFDLWSLGKTENSNRKPLSGRWDWQALKDKIAKHGLRNSLLVAPMPTASTAQILGNNESFEPYTQNLYVRRVLSGEFVQVNRHLLKDLISRGLWSDEMRVKLIAHNGSVQELDLPQDLTLEQTTNLKGGGLKDLYKTVWEIKQRRVLDMAADRGAYIDQNIHMVNATTAKLSSMHFHGWERGLKTGLYYLRTKAAADAIKFTVDEDWPQNTNHLGIELGSTTGKPGGGALLLYDLRFLRPWKQWKARAGIVDLRSADVASSHGVFAALNSRCNEVALFDVSQGSCLTLFLTDPTDDKPKEALSVPSLTEINGEATFELPSCSGPGVRSLWLPPRGAQTSLLAAGVDRKVRHWSLDPERHITEAYVVTPPETSRAERKDEDKILERLAFDSSAQNILVYFSLHQAECGSQSEAVRLGVQLESIQVLRIPTDKTAIESKAFASSGCAMVKLVIPDSVKIIGPNAFRNCDRLEAVMLPESLTEIGSAAFRGCKSLKRIVIPDSVTVIEAETFYGCEALREVVLPKFCQTIGRFAFEDCKQLVEIDIPDTVTVIGPAAFRDCPLKSLKIPKNVTEIECCTCQDCFSLESVEFPENLSVIGAASCICCRPTYTSNHLGDVFVVQVSMPKESVVATF